MSRKVTELDLRMPEFRDASPDDLEFRGDGKIVRKDRWALGIHQIQQIVLPDVRKFEIDDVVQRVRQLQDDSSMHRGDDWITSVIRHVAELPDRSSPAGQPDMLLVTAEELRSILSSTNE